MRIIYYNTRSNQSNEQQFVDLLSYRLKDYALIKKSYHLPENLINKKINIRKIENLTQKTSLLNTNKVFTTDYYSIFYR